MRVLGRLLVAAYGLAVYAFIFLPVVVLVLFSLQATSFPIPPFTGPSLRWYEAVLGDARLTSALVNSVLVAIVSSALAVALGFLAACTRHHQRTAQYQHSQRDFPFHAMPPEKKTR